MSFGKNADMNAWGHISTGRSHTICFPSPLTLPFLMLRYLKLEVRAILLFLSCTNLLSNHTIHHSICLLWRIVVVLVLELVVIMITWLVNGVHFFHLSSTCCSRVCLAYWNGKRGRKYSTDPVRAKWVCVCWKGWQFTSLVWNWQRESFFRSFIYKQSFHQFWEIEGLPLWWCFHPIYRPWFDALYFQFEYGYNSGGRVGHFMLSWIHLCVSEVNIDIIIVDSLS